MPRFYLRLIKSEGWSSENHSNSYQPLSSASQETTQWEVWAMKTIFWFFIQPLNFFFACKSCISIFLISFKCHHNMHQDSGDKAIFKDILFLKTRLLWLIRQRKWTAMNIGNGHWPVTEYAYVGSCHCSLILRRGTDGMEMLDRYARTMCWRTLDFMSRTFRHISYIICESLF